MKEGYLEKKLFGYSRDTWEMQYFKLVGHYLKNYTGQERRKMTDEPIRSIDVNEIKELTAAGSVVNIILNEDNFTFTLKADNPTVASEWIDAINTAKSIEERIDPNTGATYYYNTATAKDGWTPEEVTGSESTATADEVEERIDPNSGHPYFYNMRTEKSAWTRDEVTT